jgi:hypothetical protein
MRIACIVVAGLLALPLAAEEPNPADTEPPADRPAPEAGLAVGDRLEPFSVQDQFDRPAALDEQTRLLILAAGMQAGEDASEVLLAAGDACYRSPALIYVADISPMPSRIAERFAIPRMRQQPVPVALVRDGAVTVIPREADKVTVLALDRLTVESLQLADARGLAQALESVCGDGSPPP